MAAVSQKEEEWWPASETLVGVRANQMIINGVVYCDICWVVRADDRSPCACLREPVKTCEDCVTSKDPCAFCTPDHYENHKVAMEEKEKSLADMEKRYPDDVCLTCHYRGVYSCETCGFIPDNCLDDAEGRYDY